VSECGVLADCDVNCHKKCEKLMPHLCGVNQKLIVEALASLKKGRTCGAVLVT
jgi:novel protein kinase C delta type